MEYNTQRKHLVLPEYGRNVQNMIHHAIQLPDRKDRTNAAEAIIEVMSYLNPQIKNVDNYEHKLWIHLMMMSDFKLDVDCPYDIPMQEDLETKPERMNYPQGKITYGHYGKYTERMIHKIADLNEDDKIFYKKEIANFMKKQFLTYNNKAVENHVIVEQLEELSEGVLSLKDPDSLPQTSTLLKTMGLNLNIKRNQKKKKYRRKN